MNTKIINKIDTHLKNIKIPYYDKNLSNIAKIHKYWSRKPWYIVKEYISKYSKENEIVLDPFCGSGITGIESKSINRNFIGYDLNPFAAFLTQKSVNLSVSSNEFIDELKILKTKYFKELSEYYQTNKKCNYCNNNLYVVWFRAGPKYSSKSTVLKCLHCNKKSKIIVDSSEVSLVKIGNIPNYFLSRKFPKMDKDRFSYKGIKAVRDMLSERNIFIFYKLYMSIINMKFKEYFLLALSNTMLHVSKLKGENVRPLGVNNYWIPDDYIEENVIWRFEDRCEQLLKAIKALEKKYLQTKRTQVIIRNETATDLSYLKNSSIDYIFTDPPYGDTIQYSELSFMWNTLFDLKHNVLDEIIINPVQNKNEDEYFSFLKTSLSEMKRVLKPNRYLTICFQNKHINLWLKIIYLIKNTGFDLVSVDTYKTFGSPFNKHWSKFSPKSDFYITVINKEKKCKTKFISVDKIENSVCEYLKDYNEKFDIYYAYDLLVALMIHLVFEGYEIIDNKNLTLKKIVSKFTKYFEIDNSSFQKPTKKISKQLSLFN